MRETSRAADKKPQVNNLLKTKIGALITYAHGRQLGYNAIVMAPAHLTRKWCREIEDSVPNSVAYVVNTIEDISDLEQDINNPNKTYNLYMVMSYESAKLKYYEMPCPLYSESKQAYVCPKCGQVLTYERKQKFRGGRMETIELDHEDFTRPGRYNMTCENSIEVYNPKTNKKEIQVCKEALWRPIASEEEVGDWIKIGKYGWYKTSRIPFLIRHLERKGRSLTTQEANLLAKLQETTEKLNAKSDGMKIRGLSKYPLAQYIKRKFKKKIDYVVFDEMHKLSSAESLQGQAMGYLVQASKNTIGLTGTLINGYADSLFPILYRIIPRTMKSKGYDYDSTALFLKEYGSSKTTTTEDDKKKNKRLPGVSPLLFTDYLLDICAFIALDDVAEGLPGYAEIPLGVDLDPEVATEYEVIKESLKNNAGYRGAHRKATTSYIQLLQTYPDMPYGQAPIVDPEDNSIVFTPKNIEGHIDAKLNAIVELTESKITAGEKVLIYYTWTNITNIKDVLQEALENKGYQVAVLEAGTVKNVKREEWVEERVAEGVDVLICNPRLVETGLDLLDFTTIIWAQLDDSIFTMRQASRRSWRLGQLHDIEVYYTYYKETTQEDLLALMATKLQASMAAEGRFSEEGLSAMSQNDDITTQITNSVMKGISNKVNASSFNVTKKVVNAEKIVIHADERPRRSRQQLRYRKPFIKRWFKFKKEQPQIAKSNNAIFNLLDENLINILA